MEEKVVVIIISPIGVIPYVDEMSLWNKFFEQNDVKSYISITANGETAGQNNLCNNYSFVLINQCQEQNKIEKILKSINGSGYSIIAWTHMTRAENNYEPFVRNRIIKIFNEKLIDCEEFSHVGTPPAIKVIQNFTSNEDCTRKDQRFKEIIIDCIKKKTTSDTHSLRSQILTPFAALHLALQYAEENNKDFGYVKAECETACEKIAENEKNETLNKFLDDILKGKKGKIDGLCEAIANNKTTELAMYIDLIGDFADALEKAVESADK